MAVKITNDTKNNHEEELVGEELELMNSMYSSWIHFGYEHFQSLWFPSSKDLANVV